MSDDSFWADEADQACQNKCYSVLRLRNPENAMHALREIFPKGEANELNFVLFSTSGVHGSYVLIENLEKEPEDDPPWLTFLVVHPRIVCLRYGEVRLDSPEDFAYVKKLRASSLAAVAQIGVAETRPQEDLEL